MNRLTVVIGMAVLAISCESSGGNGGTGGDPLNGDNGPVSDIGVACINDSDCEYATCRKIQGGYCSRWDCDTSGCPADAYCISVVFSSAPAHNTSACMRDCADSSQCRQEEGYSCRSGPLTLPAYDPENTTVVDMEVGATGDTFCWPAAAPPWDSSVGTDDCADAWGSLHSCDTAPDYYVVVNKAARNAAFCQDGNLVDNYHAALSFAPVGDKVQEDDEKVPEGIFYVSRRLDLGVSNYYKAFNISYPDSEDAARGLADGLISAAEQAAIDAAQNECDEPPHTALGGRIQLTGASVEGAPDWTWGNIAVENAAIDEMWSLLQVGDTIVVVP